MTDDPRRDSKPILIIQCGGAKQGAEGDGKFYPASELYTGSLWNTYRANNKPDLNFKPEPHHLYIISAKYGLIRGDERIAHYNDRMTPQRAKGMRHKLRTQIGQEGLDQVAPERIFYVGAVGSKKKGPSPYLTALRGAGLSFTPLTEVYKEPGKRGGVGVNISALKKFLQPYRRCVDEALYRRCVDEAILRATKADRQVLTQQIAIENQRADLDFTEGVASVADWSHPQQCMDMGLQAGLGCRDLIHFIGDPDGFMASDPSGIQSLYEVVLSTWWGQQPVNHFKRFEYFSGSNSAGTFRAVVDAGRFPGVAINSCGQRSRCFQMFKALRPGLHAFIDSGAFTEWSKETVVSDDSWVSRYEAMAELAGALGYRASIVMPDKVGDEAETDRRQKVFSSLVQQIEASGAELLLPLQKDSKKHVDGRKIIKIAARNMGVPEHRLVPSIPMPAEMWSNAQIVRLARSLPGDRIHLLGTSEKESRPLTMAILAARPDMKVSSDSKKTTLGAGWGKGGGRPAKKTLRRVRSLAQHIDPEVMMLGYVGASDELDKPKVRQHLVDALGGRQRAIEWLAGAAKSSKREAGKFLDGKPTSLPWSYIVSTAVDEIPLAQLKARSPFGREGRPTLTGEAMTYWSQLEPMIGESTEAAPFNWSFVLQANGSMFLSADKMLSTTSRALQKADPRLTRFGAEELIRYVLNHPVLTRHFLSEEAGASFDDFTDFMATFSDEAHSNFMPWPFASEKIKDTHPANDPTWRVQTQIS